MLDFSLELLVIACKLKELLCVVELPKKWIVLLHHYLLVTASNLSSLESSSRSMKVLELLTNECRNAGQWLLGKNPQTQVTEVEMVGLNVDMMMLMLNVVDLSEDLRGKAATSGCYGIVKSISFYEMRERNSNRDVFIVTSCLNDHTLFCHHPYSLNSVSLTLTCLFTFCELLFSRRKSPLPVRTLLPSPSLLQSLLVINSFRRVSARSHLRYSSRQYLLLPHSGT